MCKRVGQRLLVLAVASVLLGGCSKPSNSEVADATDAQYEIKLPADSAAVPLQFAEDTPALNTARSAESQPTAIAEGADSDEPGAYKPAASDREGQTHHEHSHAAAPTGKDDQAPKRNGRAADGDDPDAPLIVAPAAEAKDDAPLNDGREPTAKPIPESERVAADTPSLPGESLDSGRVPGAKPGDTATPTGSETKPETKPAAASRKTLADLAESIQALDKDGDGQLGLYEWPREKIAEFKTLDTNEDGFLTAAELVAGQKKAADAKAAEKKPAADEKEATATTEEKAADKEPAKSDDAKEAAPEASSDNADPEEEKTTTEDATNDDESE